MKLLYNFVPINFRTRPRFGGAKHNLVPGLGVQFGVAGTKMVCKKATRPRFGGAQIFVK